uniref:C2H2-type domain-containing protein n=1 Tax=Panagrolaimus sp. ES5 TaxID=591445 RepID=A0AC34F6E9_9BILA
MPAFGIRKRFYTRGIAYTEGKGDPNNPNNQSSNSQQQSHQQQKPLSISSTTTTNSTPITEQQHQQQIPDNSLSAPYEPQGGFQLPPSDSHSDIQFNLIPVEAPPLQHHHHQQHQQQQYSEPASMMTEKKPARPENSIRERQLDPAYVEDYLARKRHKLFTCRKCKFQFPSRGHLSAHMTAHSLTEAYCYICPQCPQKFCEERRLRNHLELHASDPNSACHRCRQCDGAFRSALALRRHIDQSRACYSHPFGIKPQMMIAPSQPIDPYAFIESDEENENKGVVVADAEPLASVNVVGNGGIKRQKSIGDSGAASDASSNTTSPPRNSTLEEEYEEKTPEDSSFLSKRSKKSSENEDADSGFRSRLNSNLSCSPSSHSAISSGSDSPGRKYSTGHDYGNGGGINGSNYEALAGPSGSNGTSFGNGCYSQTSSSSRINIPPPTAHYSYGLIETEDCCFEVDSEANFGDQILQKKSVSTRNFRLIHNIKANAADNGFIDRISDIPSSEYFSSTSEFVTSNSSNGFPLETFEATKPVIETSKELKAILAIFLNALIETAKTRHQNLKQI